MIRFENIAKDFPTAQGVVHALGRTTGEIARGDFAVITGRSGAGKSTLLNILGGLMKPSEGQVRIDGQDVWSLDERRRATLRAERVGFVFQKAPVVRSLTALENVMLSASFTPDRQAPRQMSRRAEELLERVGLDHKAGCYPGQLSGGEIRRVAIVSAMMNRPRVLLADEPTGDLDVETEDSVMTEFRRLNEQGITIVIVTHHAALTEHANRLFRLVDGLLYEDDAPGLGNIPAPREQTQT